MRSCFGVGLLLRGLMAAFALGFLLSAGFAQDRLLTMPGYSQHAKMAKEIPGSVKQGTLSVVWKEGGKAFEYRKDGKTWRFDVAAGKATEATGASAPAEESPVRPGRGPGGQERPGGGAPFGVARGRQASSATSPDGKRKCLCRDRNVWISDVAGGNEIQVTTEGSEKNRIKCGTGSWVYGEELSQRSAMWWSPDGKKLAYYRFDESKVPDYALALNQTQKHARADIEAYPKPGDPNPLVDLFIYDLASKKTTKVDVRDGKPFSDDAIGHYVYRIAWSPDGRELHFNRMNRRQNVLEFAAADPETGKCRVIVREEWQPSWVNAAAQPRYLDNRRFIWTSERTGFRNFFLYDLSGKQLATLTDHPFEVVATVLVDEVAGQLWYTARSGDNPMKVQLHRVGLDGKGDVRLTDPAYHHTVDIAPDGKHFIDTIQTHSQPPATRLVSVPDGKVVAELAKSDTTKFDQLGLKRPELFTFKAADGVTELHGLLHFPSNFDPAKKHPLLVSVYAGPGTNGARETFTLPNPFTEYGFLVATLDARSAGGRGKKFLDAIYQKLGATEIDDLAAGVKALGQRPYVDRQRVGIYGGSYGGFASVMCLLKHPDVFQAACASSSVTDYRHYDSIYTERYMRLPEENKAGYDAGSALLLAPKLKGRLMLYYGTADNNVHPSNTLMLIRALQRAGKSFELQVGPDLGHSSIPQPRMMEFFIENLVVRPPAATPVESPASSPLAAGPVTDVHSFAQPQHVRVTHVALDLDVDFDQKQLRGTATLSVERTSKDETQPLRLDTRKLKIEAVEASADGSTFQSTPFSLGKEDEILGTPLTVTLPPGVKAVRLRYATSPTASGLQWLGREQTLGKQHPFLFSQSQAIHARSWLPVQDSPGVRVTYTATLRTPPGLLAVMSATNDPKASRAGVHRFEMKEAVPPYLIALAVGDLEFQEIGPRTGVYAERDVVKRAAAEFADLERMIAAVERLYGPYRWGRYDVLVLPPSAPFGGMENPRLTFLSPTILAGDKSLVALLAHELAHSWSGNLVSNATWSDFWLNEGFTVYLERRIIEALYGQGRAEMEALLGRRSLERELANLKLSDQTLHIDLKGRDPDEGLTDIPYEKGALFLRHLEQTFGRERFDAFLKGYFERFAFRSITTADFVAHLEEKLLKADPSLAAKVPVDEWLFKPGLPGTAPTFRAAAFEAVEKQASAWAEGKAPAKELRTADWSTQEWLRFLEALPAKLTLAQMAELDAALGLTRKTNAEIAFAWLLLAVRHGHAPADARLEEFLTTQGRRKFVKPLYEELAKTPAGKERALRIYAKARPTYHPITAAAIDAALKGG